MHSPRLLSPRRRVHGYTNLDEYIDKDDHDVPKSPHQIMDCTSAVLCEMAQRKCSPVISRAQLCPTRIRMGNRHSANSTNVNTIKSSSSLASSDVSLEPISSVSNTALHRRTVENVECKHMSNTVTTAETKVKWSSVEYYRQSILQAFFNRKYKRNGVQHAKYRSNEKTDFGKSLQAANGYSQICQQGRLNPATQKDPMCSFHSAPCSPACDFQKNAGRPAQSKHCLMSAVDESVDNSRRKTGFEPGFGRRKQYMFHQKFSEAGSPKCKATDVEIGAEEMQRDKDKTKDNVSDTTTSDTISHLRVGTPPPSYNELNSGSSYGPLQSNIHTNFGSAEETLDLAPRISFQPVHLSTELTGPSATIFLNDLSSGTRSKSATWTKSNDCQQQVILQRHNCYQRFGIKLDRTEKPERVTYIAMILPGSPAYTSGLQVGDRIININGRMVDRIPLPVLIETIRTTERTLFLLYQRRPFSSYLMTLLMQKEDGKVGIRLKSVEKGLCIEVVLVNSPAARVGLRAGQYVIGLNGQSVLGWSHTDAMRWLRSYPDGKNLTMTVLDNSAGHDKQPLEHGSSSMSEHVSVQSESVQITETNQNVSKQCGIRDNTFCPECLPELNCALTEDCRNRCLSVLANQTWKCLCLSSILSEQIPATTVTLKSKQAEVMLLDEVNGYPLSSCRGTANSKMSTFCVNSTDSMHCTQCKDWCPWMSNVETFICSGNNSNRLAHCVSTNKTSKALSKNLFAIPTSGCPMSNFQQFICDSSHKLTSSCRTNYV